MPADLSADSEPERPKDLSAGPRPERPRGSSAGSGPEGPRGSSAGSGPEGSSGRAGPGGPPGLSPGSRPGRQRGLSADPELEGTPRERLRQGVLTGFGLASASFALAITFGASARTLGWGMVPAIVCSLIVFSGSAQFALASALAGGGGAVPAVAAAALINARFIPMAVAIAPSVRGGAGRRALIGQAVVDGSWVAAHRGQGRFDIEKLVGATLPQWPAWVCGTAIGAVLHPPQHIVHAFALDVIFPAFFVVLLVDELRESVPSRRVAVIATVMAALLVLIVPVGIALLGASSAALLGLVHTRRAARSASTEKAPDERRVLSLELADDIGNDLANLANNPANVTNDPANRE